MTIFRQEVIENSKTRLLGEVILTQPLSIRIMVLSLIAIILLVASWLVFGTYARIESAPGILVTDQPSAKIVAPLPGVVTELLVNEGSAVHKGDRIAVINLDRKGMSGETVAGESLQALEMRSKIAKQQIALSAQHADSERTRLSNVVGLAENQATSLRSQIALQTQVVASNQNLFDQATKLVDRGFISKVEYERKRQTLIISQQQLESLRQQLAAKQAESAQTVIQLRSLTVEAEQEASQIQESQQLLAQQKAQVEGDQAYVVTAPISGRVTALQTAQGRTATPNIPIMAIVPERSALKAEIYAPSRAIGFVHPGQETRILYDAFPYQRFGSFRGTVQSVSRIVIDPRETDIPIKLEEPVYRVAVILERQTVQAYNQKTPLQPGMTLQANIILERQSFLDWLLKPLRAVTNRTT